MKAFAQMLAVAAIVTLVAIIDHTVAGPKRPRAETSMPGRHIRPSAMPAICVAYPHALAKCGVASPEEFEALRSDPELDAHYAEVGFVHPVILKADEWDYASYRGAAGIVWTPRKILLRAGERVFRDQNGNTIRARCGNRLSAEPRVPAAAEMPAEMVSETPRAEFIEAHPIIWADKEVDALLPPMPSMPTLLMPPGPSAEPPPDEGLRAELLRPSMRGSGFASGPTPIRAAPEPASWLLIPGPLVALFFLHVWRRRRIRL
ncbi:MAG: hypothetical protein ABJC09_04485 [Terriglobia bacterium]